MLYVRAIFCLVAVLISSGCRDSGGGSTDPAGEQIAGDKQGSWLLDTIDQPGGPPKSAEELARHVQYAIQQQDEVMLAALYYRIASEGYRVEADKIDRSVDSLLGTGKQNLTGIVAVELGDDEIRKREAQTFGMRVPVKLTPDITHEIRFEYQGRLEMGTSRPTSVNAGQNSGVFYIATAQVGVALRESHSTPPIQSNKK